MLGFESQVEEQFSQQSGLVAKPSFILNPAQDYSFMRYFGNVFEEHTENISWQRADKFV